jgi:hypothetical protein
MQWKAAQEEMECSGERRGKRSSEEENAAQEDEKIEKKQAGEPKMKKGREVDEEEDSEDEAGRGSAEVRARGEKPGEGGSRNQGQRSDCGAKRKGRNRKKRRYRTWEQNSQNI